MKNLYKVEYIIKDDPDYDTEEYEMENYICGWSTDKYKIFGITINHRYCVEYVDGEMYINLDNLEKEKEKLSEYSKTNRYIIFVVCDEYTVIYLGDEEIIRNFEEINSVPTIKLTPNEWIIKKLLE